MLDIPDTIQNFDSTENLDDLDDLREPLGTATFPEPELDKIPSNMADPSSDKFAAEFVPPRYLFPLHSSLSDIVLQKPKNYVMSPRKKTSGWPSMVILHSSVLVPQTPR
ncbi:hypothetical protein RIR_jg22934.t1 [Rhizophagus irregularis DAOM 181602=DAOM 197198]|nr:hypothetical protein RIR_jg22934.t1 [Rhizophagus irregularis DAOM 181602=DAOM 197198]